MVHPFVLVWSSEYDTAFFILIKHAYNKANWKDKWTDKEYIDHKK